MQRALANLLGISYQYPALTSNACHTVSGEDLGRNAAQPPDVWSQYSAMHMTQWCQTVQTLLFCSIQQLSMTAAADFVGLAYIM